MGDRKTDPAAPAIKQITPELKDALNQAKNQLKGSHRRQFMARIVKSLGHGGQRRAQRELGWNRNTIIKGTRELDSIIRCCDNPNVAKAGGLQRQCAEGEAVMILPRTLGNAVSEVLRLSRKGRKDA